MAKNITADDNKDITYVQLQLMPQYWTKRRNTVYRVRHLVAKKIVAIYRHYSSHILDSTVPLV